MVGDEIEQRGRYNKMHIGLIDVADRNAQLNRGRCSQPPYTGGRWGFMTEGTVRVFQCAEWPVLRAWQQGAVQFNDVAQEGVGVGTIHACHLKPFPLISLYLVTERADGKSCLSICDNVLYHIYGLG